MSSSLSISGESYRQKTMHRLSPNRTLAAQSIRSGGTVYPVLQPEAEPSPSESGISRFFPNEKSSAENAALSHSFSSARCFKI